MIKLSKFLENSLKNYGERSSIYYSKALISFKKVIFHQRVLLHYSGVSDMHSIKLR